MAAMRATPQVQWGPARSLAAHGGGELRPPFGGWCQRGQSFSSVACRGL